MVTEEDHEEEENTEGMVRAGASLSTLLALRHCNMLYRRSKRDWAEFRAVVQLESNARHLEAARFCNPKREPVVHLLDLRAFVNVLMFNCTTQPCLAAVLLELMSFEGDAFHSAPAKELPGIVGRTVKSLRGSARPHSGCLGSYAINM